MGRVGRAVQRRLVTVSVTSRPAASHPEPAAPRSQRRGGHVHRVCVLWRVRLLPRVPLPPPLPPHPQRRPLPRRPRRPGFPMSLARVSRYGVFVGIHRRSDDQGLAMATVAAPPVLPRAPPTSAIERRRTHPGGIRRRPPRAGGFHPTWVGVPRGSTQGRRERGGRTPHSRGASASSGRTTHSRRAPAAGLQPRQPIFEDGVSRPPQRGEAGGAPLIRGGRGPPPGERLIRGGRFGRERSTGQHTHAS